MVLRRDQLFAEVGGHDHLSIDTGTLSAILNGAGITVEEFEGLL
jgi:hypothetical protein